MLLRVGALSSLAKAPPFLSFTKPQHSFFLTRFIYPSLFHHYQSFRSINAGRKYPSLFPISRTSRLFTVAAFMPEHSSPAQSLPISRKDFKKARRELPENVLRYKLGYCSKQGDLAEALRLYDDARRDNVPLDVSHYNMLLYLCSSSSNGEDKEMTGRLHLGIERGFQIFKQMCIDKVAPDEAAFTSAARLAASKEDPEMAFDLIKQMRNCGIPPKLRSYGPALFGFCKKGMTDRAYELDAHMIESGVLAEEPELSALLKLSSEANRADKVYEIIHRLRATVRQVSEETACILENWFNSENAAIVGMENWDAEKVKEGVVIGGGGWHGQGWLGSGRWRVVRTQVNNKGVCSCCGEKLVCIDIDPKETENFASSLATLACQKEIKSDFMQFQEWLQKHGPYDAVIDGANVGLVKQHEFNFFQLKSVVCRLREMSPSKRFPLVILHRKRVTDGPARLPKNKMLLENWKRSGVLYPTPAGSNDDWYWLYAAVSSKCLLVTNDEMRDHLFQLLGTSFFPRWKEKHQVRLTVSRDGINLHMPPPYSLIIQESEQGSWHVPTVVVDDLETPRQWMCATRTRAS